MTAADHTMTVAVAEVLWANRYRLARVDLTTSDIAPAFLNVAREVAEQVREVQRWMDAALRCADGSLIHDFKGQSSCPACGFRGLTLNAQQVPFDGSGAAS